MGGGVEQRDRRVMGSAHDLVRYHHERADRDLPGVETPAGFLERFTHEEDIRIGGRRTR